MIDMNYGARLAERRKALDLTADELARRAGINHRVIAYIEDGSNTSVGTITKIEAALKARAEELVKAGQQELETATER